MRYATRFGFIRLWPYLTVNQRCSNLFPLGQKPGRDFFTRPRKADARDAVRQVAPFPTQVGLVWGCVEIFGLGLFTADQIRGQGPFKGWSISRTVPGLCDSGKDQGMVRPCLDTTQESRPARFWFQFPCERAAQEGWMGVSRTNPESRSQGNQFKGVTAVGNRLNLFTACTRPIWVVPSSGRSIGVRKASSSLATSNNHKAGQSAQAGRKRGEMCSIVAGSIPAALIISPSFVHEASGLFPSPIDHTRAETYAVHQCCAVDTAASRPAMQRLPTRENQNLLPLLNTKENERACTSLPVFFCFLTLRATIHHEACTAALLFFGGRFFVFCSFPFFYGSSLSLIST